MTNRSERSVGRSVGVAMRTLPVTTSRGNVQENVKMDGWAAFAIKVSKLHTKKHLKITNQVSFD